MRMSWRLLGGVAAIALVAGTAEAATPADTFVMAKQIDDIITLDPQESFEFSGNEIGANTYERVMNFEATDLTNLKPGAVESYAVSDADLSVFIQRSIQTFLHGVLAAR